MCTCMPVETSKGSLGARVTGSCEMPDMMLGARLKALYEKSVYSSH